MASGHFIVQPGGGGTNDGRSPQAGIVEREREEDEGDAAPGGPSHLHGAPAATPSPSPAASTGSSSTGSHKSARKERRLPLGPPPAAPSVSPHPVAALPATESKDEFEALSPPPRSSAAIAALEASSESEDEALTSPAANTAGDAEEEDKPSGPTAAEIYARPLLFYKRATADRRRNGGDRSHESSELGPAQLLLPDSGMALGFPPLKETARNRRRDEPNDGEPVVVFTPPNEEQASKTKLWACILFFLIPANVILICVIFFLGGAQIDDESYNAGTTDLVTFLCALIALCLGLIGMKLKDTRILTLFITIYYVDALINLVRVSSILQLAQFFMQIGVCHSMGHFKSTLTGTWWVADT